MRNEPLTRWHVLYETIKAGHIAYLGGSGNPDISFKEQADAQVQWGCGIKQKLGVYTMMSFPSDFNAAAIGDFLGGADRDIPKIALDQELTVAVNDDHENSIATLKALREMDLLELPYDQVIVEVIPEDGRTARRFAIFQLLTSDEIENVRAVNIERGIGDEAYDVLGFLVELMRAPNGGQLLAVFDPVTLAMRFDAHPNDGTFGLRYSAGLPQFFNHTDRIVRACKAAHTDTVQVLGNALACLYLMMKTRGVERNDIAGPPKLNKLRAAKKQAAIPSVTHLHLKHVFDKSGSKAVETRHRSMSGDGCPINGKALTGDPYRFDGRKKLKLVRGHPRDQPYGPGRALTKQIFIAPYFRNIEAGEAAPIAGPTLRLSL